MNRSAARRALTALLLSLVATVGLQLPAGAASAADCTGITSVHGAAPSVSQPYLAAQKFEISLTLRLPAAPCSGIAYRIYVHEDYSGEVVGAKTTGGSPMMRSVDLGSLVTDPTRERALDVSVQPYAIRGGSSYPTARFDLTVPASSYDTATQSSASSCVATTPYGYTKPC